MPWCDDCSKFWNPSSMPPDGTCRTCGRIIAEPPDTRVPWHFWILLGALALYLGWRLVQGFQWLTDNGHGLWAVVLGIVVVAVAGWAIVWWRSDRGGEDATAAGIDEGGATSE